MGLQRDLIVLGAIIFILSGAALAVGITDLPGTGNVKVPGDGSGETTYALDTSIDVKGKIIDAELNDPSFEYDTVECGSFGCGSLSFSETPLFAFGADNVEVTVALYNSEGVKVGESHKYIGDVEWTQTEVVQQRFSNIAAGDYTVEYILRGQGSYGDVQYESTFDVQVPETIAEGGAN